MSVIPAFRLSSSDLMELGNNVLPAVVRDRTDLATINRSLAAVGEQVERLYPPRTRRRRSRRDHTRK